jgi:transcriptional regulator with XRE-family HTH domain
MEPAMWSKIENDRHEPTDETIKRVAKALNLSAVRLKKTLPE